MKNLSLSLLVLFAFSLIISCQKTDNPAKIEPLLDQYVAVWNGDSLAKLDKIAHKNFELRIVPSFDPGIGIGNLKNEIKGTRTYFPDFLLKETEKLIISDTAIVIRWIATGTFKNRNKMSGKNGRLNVPGFSVIFFNKGKLTGEWIAYSDLTWYKQLGFTLVPPVKTGK
jgi:hypothetical protein